MSVHLAKIRPPNFLTHTHFDELHLLITICYVCHFVYAVQDKVLQFCFYIKKHLEYLMCLNVKDRWHTPFIGDLVI